ncbi:CDP-glycerol glycerophosphotransferase family protein [Aliikangiella coralliicola]|uniref:CDP-glycerol--glycerophosphate glycerophosphotransferase n=1 Tax=Aliikangiella coralliicola TaxID=2592383 RepID=A0A545TW29_9GAMM|nr:CDP-glycerol glycerophosphotransferase family protein [Aliikangiella coralliicola]TQV81425.1 CDP-glycerol--glycerophosphate glycerophosphotransferase [Aliikangiella coralliicola]
MHKYLFFVAQNYSYAILRPLQQAIKERGDEVVWFLYGNQINTDYLLPDEKRLFTVEEVIAYHPDASFVPGNMIPSFISGLKVSVFHGFNVGKLNGRGKNDHFNIRGCFDLYCTQGPNTTIRFQQLAEKYGYFNVVETGWPALDPLYSKQITHRQNTSLDTDNEKPTILMCSTFSRNLTCAPHLYEEIKKLSQNDQWRWLVQFHPKMPDSIVSQYKALQNENLTFIETDNVLPLLQQADVMLCDTSSVMLMFILQNKPVVTFKNISPGAHLIDFSQAEELEQHLNYALKRPPELMEEIQRFVEELHPYQDSQSSQRVLDAVEAELKKTNRTRKKKPLNLLRNFKMRKELNYWKF